MENEGEGGWNENYFQNKRGRKGGGKNVSRVATLNDNHSVDGFFFVW